MSTDFPPQAPNENVPRLQLLEACHRLHRATDDVLEVAQRDRLPLQQAIESLLPLLASHTGAHAIQVHALDEDLLPRTFEFGDPTLFERGHVLEQSLDVAQESLGDARIAFSERLAPVRQGIVEALFETWCEEVDNYLAAIAQMRKAHQVTSAISKALRDPLIDDAVMGAVEALRREVAITDLVVAFRHYEDPRGASLHYLVVQDDEVTHESRAGNMELDEFMRAEVPRMLEGNAVGLIKRLGLDHAREERLIEGVTDGHVIGTVLAQSQTGSFNTFDRDLIERFADSLRQRITDYNREWQSLRAAFAPDVVRALMQTKNYPILLEPREQDVAILFADIVGFTRLCEQVIESASDVGKLVDQWGAGVAEIIWGTRGVFDKMVGDCVIAMWGPPLNLNDAQENCHRAAAAARLIRDFTRTLGDGRIVEALKGEDIDIAIGLMHTRVCVGVFGPDRDYTAFGSGMNNAARLQGLARKGEILCSESFVQAYDLDDAFGEVQEGAVKNVKEPLIFRALK